ncbi:preprotein translocase subunit YajC [Limosilactobacillus sp.]|uniref:preprotein translocase subunit YajC n=1 Tax=Limosilactobacillus sp. TaxID=2773925 RepID=UPI003F07FB77
MDKIVNISNFLTLGAAGSGNAGYSSIILIVLMIALMYFFMIRPQQKQRKQHQEMMNELHKGDEVVTIGRLHGKIDSVNKEDQTVTIDCEGIYLTFDMVAIARVVKRASENTPAQPAAKEAAPAEKKDDADESKAADAPASDAADDTAKDDDEK